MLRALSLAAVSVFACACVVPAPTADDGDQATDEGALPRTTDPGDTTADCPPQRFDFVLTPGDTRTCASFTKTTLSGRWTGITTFPTAPESIRNKHCAAIFTSKKGTCTRVTKQDLSLRCEGYHSIVERNAACAQAGTTCRGSGRRWSERDVIPASMTPEEVELECPALTPPAPIHANPGTMMARTYSGGCGNCGSLWGSTAYITAPSQWLFLTFYSNPAPAPGYATAPEPVPVTIGYEAQGPIAVDLSAYNPSGPLVVTF